MDIDKDTYQKFLDIATGQIYSIVSPSARHNVVEDVAADAIAELLQRMERGDEVQNPESLLSTIARHRALDARRKWKVRRHQRIGHGDAIDPIRGDQTLFFNDLDRNLARSLEDGHFDNLDVGAWLVDLARDSGLEAEDVELAHRLFIDQESVSEIAVEMGVAEKTVYNRRTAIKRRLLNELRSD